MALGTTSRSGPTTFGEELWFRRVVFTFPFLLSRAVCIAVVGVSGIAWGELRMAFLLAVFAGISDGMGRIVSIRGVRALTASSAGLRMHSPTGSEVLSWRHVAAMESRRYSRGYGVLITHVDSPHCRGLLTVWQQASRRETAAFITLCSRHTRATGLGTPGARLIPISAPEPRAEFLRRGVQDAAAAGAIAWVLTLSWVYALVGALTYPVSSGLVAALRHGWRPRVYELDGELWKVRRGGNARWLAKPPRRFATWLEAQRERDEDAG